MTLPETPTFNITIAAEAYSVIKTIRLGEQELGTILIHNSGLPMHASYQNEEAHPFDTIEGAVLFLINTHIKRANIE